MKRQREDEMGQRKKWRSQMEPALIEKIVLMNLELYPRPYIEDIKTMKVVSHFRVEYCQLILYINYQLKQPHFLHRDNWKQAITIVTRKDGNIPRTFYGRRRKLFRAVDEMQKSIMSYQPLLISPY